MLEKIMDLHILLYAMAALGGLGAVGMLATHLTYRRLIRKNTGIENKSQRKVAEPLEDQGQAVKQNEQDGMVPIPSIYRSSGCSFLVF